MLCRKRAATTDKKAAKNWGNLVLAVDPELMGDKAEFAVRREATSTGRMFFGVEAFV